MRPAPACAAQVGDGGLWRLLQALPGALACAVIAAWLAGHAQAQPPLQALCALLAAMPAGVWAWRRPSAAAIRLSWDGQHWMLCDSRDGATPHPGRVSVDFALADWALLRFVPDDGPARWLPLQGAALDTLRAALFAAPMPARPDAVE